MAVKISRNSFIMEKPPTIYGYGSVVGDKEGEGPMAKYFDEVSMDGYFGQKTWEKAESELLKRAVSHALKKSSLKPEDIDYMFAGDLQNQCCSTTY
ncbi:MAG: stage V sporulation protein AD, partial [Oscillospiraceae bacterium]